MSGSREIFKVCIIGSENEVDVQMLNVFCERTCSA
jgi:hypothetical protein